VQVVQARFPVAAPGIHLVFSCPIDVMAQVDTGSAPHLRANIFLIRVHRSITGPAWLSGEKAVGRCALL